MNEHVFAVLILLLPALGAVAAWRFGEKPGWKRVLAAVLFAGAAGAALVAWTPTHYCDQGLTQAGTLASVLSASLLVASMRRKAVLIPAVIVVLAAGQVLQGVASRLVHETNSIGYTEWPYIGLESWQDRFHRLPSYGCVRRAEAWMEAELEIRPPARDEGWIEDLFDIPEGGGLREDFVELEGAEVRPSWHSFFTGLHRLETERYGIWCSGGAGGAPALSIRHRSPEDATERDRILLAIDRDPYETLLLPLQSAWRVGEPMRVRAEVTPKGQERAYREGARDDFVVTGPDGKEVPRIGEFPLSREVALERGPDGRFVYADEWDLLRGFVIPRPGRYAVRFTGRGLTRRALPSDPLVLDVGEGPRPPVYDLAGKLAPLIPENWILTLDYTKRTVALRGGGSLEGAELSIHDDLPGIFAVVEVYALEGKAVPKSHWTDEPEYLGESGGLHYYRVEFGDRGNSWPRCSEAVRDAILGP